MAGILVLDVMLPLGLAGMLYVALVIISLWSPKRTFTLTVAGACTALILFDYHHASVESETTVAIANRALAFLAIWATAILSLLRTRDQEDIQILRSLLPLCATCKKIRDTRGIWHQLEQYLKENSHMEFSRSLCPECRKKWVPGETA
ncbi:MAG: hypothetical protein ACREJU_10960 [Nitrospiraceae bacterium]